MKYLNKGLITKIKDEKIIEDYEIKFCSETDKNAIKSYTADESLNGGDITRIEGPNLLYCDILIGRFVNIVCWKHASITRDFLVKM